MYYTEAGLDRLAEQRADTEFVEGLWRDPAARVLPVWDGKNLIADSENGPIPAWLSPSEFDALWRSGRIPEPNVRLLLGRDETAPWFAAGMPRDSGQARDTSQAKESGPGAIDEIASKGRFLSLRDVGTELPRAQGAMLAYARGMLAWHESHGFCARCGSPSRPADAGHRRKCTGCGRGQYPRVDPAVIMLPIRGDHCLLAHNRKRPAKYFSCVAGFVEIGESLEEAVARETMEEVGLRATKVSYFASQPWPFPSSLMFGYFAECPEGEPVPDGEEIAETIWLTRDDLRNIDRLGIRLPPPDSMARQLMAAWVAAGG